MDGPTAGYETIMIGVKLDKGTVVARHTHPGIESVYIIEGSIEVAVEGRDTKVYETGQAIQIPPETPHGSGKPPSEDVHFISNYIVEKDKPLTKFV
jgi:quercetin dioxygenase-like cupin family protein